LIIIWEIKEGNRIERTQRKRKCNFEIASKSNQLNLLTTKNDIKNFFSKEEFVLKTCQQIQKDLLGLSSNNQDFKIDFNQDVMLQLVDLMQLELKNLSGAELQQFIYKVDLNEHVFNAAIAQNDDYEELIFLIIQREAQKVYLKHKFS